MSRRDDGVSRRDDGVSSRGVEGYGGGKGHHKQRNRQGRKGVRKEGNPPRLVGCNGTTVDPSSAESNAHAGGVDGVKVDAGGVDGVKVDAGGVDRVKVDAGGVDGVKVDAGGVDGVKVDAAASTTVGDTNSKGRGGEEEVKSGVHGDRGRAAYGRGGGVHTEGVTAADTRAGDQSARGMPRKRGGGGGGGDRPRRERYRGDTRGPRGDRQWKEAPEGGRGGGEEEGGGGTDDRRERRSERGQELLGSPNPSSSKSLRPQEGDPLTFEGSQGYLRHGKHLGGQRMKPLCDRKPTSSSLVASSTLQSDILAEQLAMESYECMVCCDRVRARDEVWSCPRCYHLFHLRCIGRWAISPAAAVNPGKCVLVCVCVCVCGRH